MSYISQPLRLQLNWNAPLRATPTRQTKSQRLLPAASCQPTAPTCMPTTAPQQLPPAPAMPAPRGPKLDHWNVDLGITSEQWNVFQRRWNSFVVGSGIDPDASSAQFLQCAGDALGDALLRSDPDIISKPTSA